MMGIQEFLLARIEQDERAAMKLAETDNRPVLSLAITVNHPQRILAECAAKRAILGMHRNMPSPFEEGLCAVCAETGPDAQAFPCDTIKALAAVYSDHPAYQEEWKP